MVVPLDLEREGWRIDRLEAQGLRSQRALCKVTMTRRGGEFRRVGVLDDGTVIGLDLMLKDIIDVDGYVVGWSFPSPNSNFIVYDLMGTKRLVYSGASENYASYLLTTDGTRFFIAWSTGAGWQVAGTSQVKIPIISKLTFLRLLEGQLYVGGALAGGDEPVVWDEYGCECGKLLPGINDAKGYAVFGIRSNHRWYVANRHGFMEAVCGVGTEFFASTSIDSPRQFFIKKTEGGSLVVIDSAGRTHSQIGFDDIGRSDSPALGEIGGFPVFKGRRGSRWYVSSVGGTILDDGRGGYVAVRELFGLGERLYFRAVFEATQSRKIFWWKVADVIQREALFRGDGTMLGDQAGYDHVWPVFPWRDGIAFVGMLNGVSYIIGENGDVIGDSSGYPGSISVGYVEDALCVKVDSGVLGAERIIREDGRVLGTSDKIEGFVSAHENFSIVRDATRIQVLDSRAREICAFDRRVVEDVRVVSLCPETLCIFTAAHNSVDARVVTVRSIELKVW